MQSVQANTEFLEVPHNTQSTVISSVLPQSEVKPVPQNQRISKNDIRKSLKASTADGVFAAVFDITTTGILLSNFLVELGANAVQIGMLSSIPMLVNLLQPLGAYLSERIDSRHSYCLWTHGAARFIWFFLALAIGAASWGWGDLHNHQLVVLTLLTILASHVLTALGSASWLSWMAMLVPRKLRGRYFGLRNSLASFTKLIYVPIAGLIVSFWPGGAIQGFGVVLLIGLLAGGASLACQFLKTDINPQSHNYSEIKSFNRNKVSDSTEKQETLELQNLNQNFNQPPSM
ncbi:MAG: MFS transporter, partial [Cyanobacteria bacterium J06641_2]